MEEAFLVAAGQRRTLLLSDAHMAEPTQASIPILDIEEAEVAGGAPVKKEGRWNATRLAMVTFSLCVSIAFFVCVIVASKAAKRSQSGPKFDRMAFENGLVSQARVPGTGGICQTPGTCLSGIDRESILLELGMGQCEFNRLFDWTYPTSVLDLQQRAGEVYHPPWGWARLAFHLKDLSILDGKDGWVIAYHGTGAQWIPNIMKHGLLVRGGSTTAKNGAVYGSGIYVSPNVEYSKYYAEPQCVNGRSMYPVLTCRLRPGSFTKTNMDYIWLVQSSDDIVCTGLLVKIHGDEVAHHCTAPQRETVSDCDEIQKNECCWNQERSTRCLVVDNAHCQSATFVASDDFDGQITGCPHDAPGKRPIDWTSNGPYEELPDSIYRPKATTTTTTTTKTKTTSVLMCQGHHLVAIASADCPDNAGSLRHCDQVSPGEMCEGDGECGTHELNNCANEWDIYLLEAWTCQGRYLAAIASTDCPASPGSLAGCDSAGPGEMCEASGECGTNVNLGNCLGGYDLYRLEA